jgi:hypothetical protein
MLVVQDPSQLTGFTIADDPLPKRRAVVDDGDVVDIISDDPEAALDDEAEVNERSRVDIKESQCEFTSISNLRRLAQKRSHKGELSLRL